VLRQGIDRELELGVCAVPEVACCCRPISTLLVVPLGVPAVAVVVVLPPASPASLPSASLSLPLTLSKSTVLVLLRDSRDGLFVTGLRVDCGVVVEPWLRVFARASSELEGLGREGRDDGGVPSTLGGEGDRVVLVSAAGVFAELSFGCPSAGAADFIVDHKPVMIRACLTCESQNHQ